jgi:hypothetical protein
MRVVILKPQDVIVALKLGLVRGSQQTLSQLGHALGLSASEVHASINRGSAAALVDLQERRVRARNFLEFLEHGIRFVFVAERGPIVRGVPTAHSAPPLARPIGMLEQLYRPSSGPDSQAPSGLLSKPYEAHGDPPVVWPHPEGTVRGESIEPLYPSAVDAALRDPQLHQGLALVDVLRIGRSREKELAIAHLKQLLSPS